MDRAHVIVVGLGPGDERYLTLGVINILRQGDPILLRTARHPAVSYLEREGIEFRSFDSRYDRADSYDRLYDDIATAVVEAAQESGQVVYAVPGSPVLLEATVARILRRAEERGARVSMVPGLGFIDVVLAGLPVPADSGLAVVTADGDQWPRAVTGPLIIAQVTNRNLARSVKLRLLAAFPADHLVYRVSGELVESVPLASLDRGRFDHLTSVVVPPGLRAPDPTPTRGFSDAVAVVARLRGEGGCPWDREQTIETLRPYVIEEAHEVVAAIDAGSVDGLQSELGDLVLQVLLLSRVAEEEGKFTVDDVFRSMVNKMVRRHPHVFGDAEVEDSRDVLRQWEQIKEQERMGESGLFDELPASLPALIAAYRVQEKAAQLGFDWDSTEPVLDKISEELAELAQAYRSESKETIQEEAGDLLFSVVNVCRFLDVEPEMVLQGAIRKFVDRFSQMEALARAQGKDLGKMSLTEMNDLWELCKRPAPSTGHKP